MGKYILSVLKSRRQGQSDRGHHLVSHTSLIGNYHLALMFFREDEFSSFLASTIGVNSRSLKIKILTARWKVSHDELTPLVFLCLCKFLLIEGRGRHADTVLSISCSVCGQLCRNEA